MAKKGKYTCCCGRRFDEEKSRSKHYNACSEYKQQSAQKKRDRQQADMDEGAMERERQLVFEERRRRREQEAAVKQLMRSENSNLSASGSRGQLSAGLCSIPEVDEGIGGQAAEYESAMAERARSLSPQTQMNDFNELELGPLSPAPADEMQIDPPLQNEDAQTDALLGRGRRTKRATQKVMDMRPDGPRPIVTSESSTTEHCVPPVDAPPSPAEGENNTSDNSQRPAIRRVILRVTERFKTAKNAFKMWREYRGRPTNIPDLHQTAETTFEPTAKRAAAKTPRPIRDIIHPFPNISAWRFRRHYWLVPNHNSQVAMDKFLVEVAQRKDFDMNEAKHVNYKKIDAELANASLPWEDAAHGWRKASISINVPTGEKRSKKSRRSRRTTCEDADDDDNDGPTEASAAGRKFDVSDIHYRPISQVIQSTFSSEKDMHYEPFEEYVETSQRNDDGSPGVEHVYTEVYNSRRFLEEHEKLQRTPPEPKYPNACMMSSKIGAKFVAAER